MDYRLFGFLLTFRSFTYVLLTSYLLFLVLLTFCLLSKERQSKQIFLIIYLNVLPTSGLLQLLPTAEVALEPLGVVLVFAERVLVARLVERVEEGSHDRVQMVVSSTYNR